MVGLLGAGLALGVWLVVPGDRAEREPPGAPSDPAVVHAQGQDGPDPATTTRAVPADDRIRTPAATPERPSRVNLRGRVEDDRGSPLPGAEVEGEGAKAVAGEDGRFHLENVPSGEAVLRASHPAHFPAEIRWTPSAGSSSAEEVVLRLDRRLTLAGIVLDGQDRPVEDTQLFAPPPKSREGRRTLDPALRTKSGPAGRFGFFPLRPGLYELSGLGPKGSIEHAVVELVEDRMDVVLRTRMGETGIAGVLRDCASGEPLPAASGMFLTRTRAGEGGRAAGGPGTDGRFGIRMWTSDSSRRLVTRLVTGFASPDYEPRILQIEAEREDLDRLEVCLNRRRPGKGVIEGKVSFDDGVPCEGEFEVHLWSPDALFGEAGVPRVGIDRSSRVRDPEGSFEIPDLEAGDWLVQVDVPEQGFLRYELEKVVSVDPDRRSGVQWTLPRGGDVRVQAIGTGGAAERFHAYLENEVREIHAFASTGVAEFKNVPPGRYGVRVVALDATVGEEPVVVERSRERTVVVPLGPSRSGTR